MKNSFLLIITLIVSGYYNSIAQIQDGGDHGLMTLTTKNINLNEVQGSPYLNLNFEPGTVSIEGKSPLVGFLRYDVLNEVIEIKTNLNSPEIFVLPTTNKATYKFDNKDIVYDQIYKDSKKINGYVIEHFKGKNFRLVEKPTATITEPVRARTGYESDQFARIRIDQEFYIQKKNGNFENVRIKQKDIRNAFNSPEANKYLSDNKIKTIDDLIGFLKYLDSK